MVISTQKIHSIIQNKIGILSSKHSIFKRIDRTSYDVRKYTGFIGVMSGKHIKDIAEALKQEGLNIDSSNIDRGFIKILN